MRLDKYLAAKFPDYSRNQIQKFIKRGLVLMNNEKVKAGYEVKESDKVLVKKIKQEKTKLKSEKMDLKILYEDKSCMVIDKPAGVIVHPGSGHSSGTIANAILKKIKGRVGSAIRPGIVHRLDKNTSGILIVAKTQKGYLNLIKQFEERSVEKTYLTLVSGELEHAEGIIEAPIGRSFQDRKKMSVRLEGHGKNAVSSFKLLKSYQIGEAVVNLLNVRIFTGRTHQIRVHMAAIGHPVVGDELYGKSGINKLFQKEFGLNRQFLHANTFKFVSPDTGKEVFIKSDLPKELDEITRRL